jgi:hypothetical protein
MRVFGEAHPVKPFIMMFAQLHNNFNFVKAFQEIRSVACAVYATKSPNRLYDLCRVRPKRCRSAS